MAVKLSREIKMKSTLTEKVCQRKKTLEILMFSRDFLPWDGSQFSYKRVLIKISKYF